MVWFQFWKDHFGSRMENELQEPGVKAVRAVKSFCFLMKQDCKSNLAISVLYRVLVYFLSKQHLFHVYCISPLTIFFTIWWAFELLSHLWGKIPFEYMHVLVRVFIVILRSMYRYLSKNLQIKPLWKFTGYLSLLEEFSRLQTHLNWV